jgi:hypothetical protein
MSLDDMARIPESWNVFARMMGRDWRGFAGGQLPLTRSNDPPNALFLCLNQERVNRM